MFLLSQASNVKHIDKPRLDNFVSYFEKVINNNIEKVVSILKLKICISNNDEMDEEEQFKSIALGMTKGNFHDMQIRVIKTLRSDDIAKLLLLLDKKSPEMFNKEFDSRLRAGLHTLLRLAEIEAVTKLVKSFRRTFPFWEKELPKILESEDFGERKLRLRNLKSNAERREALKQETLGLVLLRDLCDIKYETILTFRTIFDDQTSAGKTANKNVNDIKSANQLVNGTNKECDVQLKKKIPVSKISKLQNGGLPKKQSKTNANADKGNIDKLKQVDSKTELKNKNNNEKELKNNIKDKGKSNEKIDTNDQNVTQSNLKSTSLNVIKSPSKSPNKQGSTKQSKIKLESKKNKTDNVTTPTLKETKNKNKTDNVTTPTLKETKNKNNKLKKEQKEDTPKLPKPVFVTKIKNNKLKKKEHDTSKLPKPVFVTKITPDGFAEINDLPSTFHPTVIPTFLRDRLLKEKEDYENSDEHKIAVAKGAESVMEPSIESPITKRTEDQTPVINTSSTNTTPTTQNKLKKPKRKRTHTVFDDNQDNLNAQITKDESIDKSLKSEALSNVEGNEILQSETILDKSLELKTVSPSKKAKKNDIEISSTLVEASGIKTRSQKKNKISDFIEEVHKTISKPDKEKTNRVSSEEEHDTPKTIKKRKSVQNSDMKTKSINQTEASSTAVSQPAKKQKSYDLNTPEQKSNNISDSNIKPKEQNKNTAELNATKTTDVTTTKVTEQTQMKKEEPSTPIVPYMFTLNNFKVIDKVEAKEKSTLEERKPIYEVDDNDINDFSRKFGSRGRGRGRGRGGFGGGRGRGRGRGSFGNFRPSDSNGPNNYDVGRSFNSRPSVQQSTSTRSLLRPDYLNSS